MSVPVAVRRRTAPEIRGRKGGQPIVALTAYGATMARLVDEAADLLLVGDSVAMVEHGMDSTLGATLDMMIAHGRAVMAGSARALVVVDLPFGSYEASPEAAFRSAARVLAETGCGAVKLEGGARMAETIGFLAARGVPVMAHVGLTPQSVNALGGFRTQGHDAATYDAVLADAAAVAEAGAFAVVVEGVVEPLAAEITRRVVVPTIGIGASPVCDGQILVLEDMLGLTPRAPRFARRFADLGAAVRAAAEAYAGAVRERSFPAEAELYRPKGRDR